MKSLVQVTQVENTVARNGLQACLIQSPRLKSICTHVPGNTELTVSGHLGGGGVG